MYNKKYFMNKLNLFYYGILNNIYNIYKQILIIYLITYIYIYILIITDGKLNYIIKKETVLQSYIKF